MMFFTVSYSIQFAFRVEIFQASSYGDKEGQNERKEESNLLNRFDSPEEDQTHNLDGGVKVNFPGGHSSHVNCLGVTFRRGQEEEESFIQLGGDKGRDPHVEEDAE